MDKPAGQRIGITLTEGIYGFFRTRVLVLRVAPDSPLAGLGVVPGSVVLTVNGLPVRNGEHARDLMAEATTVALCIRLPERERKKSGTSIEIQSPPSPQTSRDAMYSSV